MKVTYKEWNCLAIGHKYDEGKSRAIELVDQDDYECIAMATVNMPGETIPDDCVFAPEYKTPGLTYALINAGIIHNGVQGMVKAGFVNLQSYKLTKEALENLW